MNHTEKGATRETAAMTHQMNILFRQHYRDKSTYRTVLHFDVFGHLAFPKSSSAMVNAHKFEKSIHLSSCVVFSVAMASSREKPPCYEHAGEPRLILPTKAYYVPQDDGRLVSQPHPDSPPRWTAQPILHWLETLASATEHAESCEQNLPEQSSVVASVSVAPICIDSIQLSGASYCVPAISTALYSVEATRYLSGYSIPPPYFYNPAGLVDHQALTQSAPLPIRWDLSFLQKYDHFVGECILKIKSLAFHLESLLPNECVGSQYHIIQLCLQYTVERITRQWQNGTSAEHDDANILHTLCMNTIRKLERILDTAHQSPSSASRDDQMQDEIIEQDLVDDDERMPPPRTSVSKRDFTLYMMDWLRENFTNPFPDEKVLSEISRSCNVTPAVINNWLINQRTRKWRKSINMALGLKDRPSCLLLHDSVHFFDGLSVNDLLPVECFDVTGGVIPPPSRPPSSSNNLICHQPKSRKRRRCN